ncbi:MAG: carbohydrate-binding protein [Planctomycetota bacterium]
MELVTAARSAALVACVSAALGSLSFEAAAQQRQEVLIWSDEFDGSAVDTDNWEFQIGTGASEGLFGWGNNELQYYREQNATVADGKLTIEARRESFGNSDYTSSRLRSAGKFEFAYGKVEASIRLPSTPGIWPAFWMLPTSSPYGIWAASGEIDIMESVNFADRIYGTIHYGGPFPGNTQAGGQFADGTDFSEGFHTYTLEWDPNQMRWFVDGQLYKVINRNIWFSTANRSDPRAPFDRDFHLLLNVAVGGNFPGNPNGQSQFPQSMQVDWVRVYQLDPIPFGGSATQLPGRVQAENFDEGYPGQTYFDVDAENKGFQYRPGDDVDIEATQDGGFNVGFIDFGEWMEYTVDIAQAGEYTMTARVASQSTGGAFSLQIDGVPVAGFVPVPATGGFQDWTTVSTTVTLPAGEHVLRFQNFSGSEQAYNLDWLEFAFNGNPCPADANGDGTVTPADFSAWILAYNAGDPSADQNGDGLVLPNDFTAWVVNYNAGCP